MRFDADALGLSATGTLLLRDLIHERTGVYFDGTRTNLLLDKLAPLVIDRGFDSFLDYYYLLRYDAAADEEWGRVMDALAVPETYFWREVDQLRAVVDVVVPELAKRSSAFTISSIPCSTGEEPLTIAMLLNEAGWFQRARIEIVGADASPAAIAKAGRGLYRDRSFRNTPEAMRRKYFSHENGLWRVSESVHCRVRWKVVNIVDEGHSAPLVGAPIVFCRNLLIYFSEHTLRKTVEMFADLMPTPGYLCLGASESLLRYTTRFHLEEIGGAYVYVKR